MFGLGLYIGVLLAITGVTHSKSGMLRIPLKRTKSGCYVSKIGVGTPPQKFWMMFDTGSTVLWVPSSTCESATCKTHNRFSAKQSHSYYDLNRTSPLNYMAGMIEVEEGMDTMWIKGMKVENQYFGTVTRTINLTINQFDGLVGLGFEESEVPQPLLYNMYHHKLISKFWASFYLDRQKNNGELYLGGSKQLEDDEEIVWLKVTQETDHFRVPLQSIDIGNQSFIMAEKYPATFDSGTPGIVGPKEEVDKIYALLGYSYDDRYVNCNIISDLPDIIFNLNGKLFPLRPKQYMRKVQYYGQETCSLLIEGVNIPGYDTWLMGVIFNEVYPVIYNFKEREMGIIVPKSR